MQLSVFSSEESVACFVYDSLKQLCNGNHYPERLQRSY